MLFKYSDRQLQNPLSLVANFKRDFSINFRIRNESFKIIFDEIDDHYSKIWRSVHDKEDENTLNILLPVLAASGIDSDVKEIVFINLGSGNMATKTGVMRNLKIT